MKSVNLPRIPHLRNPGEARIQAQVFLTPELVLLSSRPGSQEGSSCDCQAIARSVLVALSGVLAPDPKAVKRAG